MRGFRFSASHRVVQTILLFLVALLTVGMTGAISRAAPDPAPARHADGPVIAVSTAPVAPTPPRFDAPATDAPILTPQPTATPRTANVVATPTATATTLHTATGATTSTAKSAATSAATATAMSTATPVATNAPILTPGTMPYAIAPQNHPRVSTPPPGTVVPGTISPLPTRHPDATLPPMSSITPITRTDVARGIQYTSWWNGEYSSGESDLTLAQKIVPLGANWLAPIVTGYSQTTTSTVIDRTSQRTPTDADLTHLIATTHAQGIKVMLKPHVDLDDPNHWRGEISMNSELDWSLWFTNYTAFITHYAALAQATHTEMFSLGTELQGTSGRAAQWRQVVTAVRAVYTIGTITYAANHGEEVSVTWWDALDSIGVDAYYPLTTIVNPTVPQLKAAWVPTVALLATLSTTYQKPVIFTEVGYQSQAGANITPWNVTSNVLDLQEQANCYTALLEVFRDISWWHGVFWWSATPYRDQGGITDMDFTPINKPAGDVLRNYYSGVGTGGVVGTPLPAPGRHPDATRTP